MGPISGLSSSSSSCCNAKTIPLSFVRTLISDDSVDSDTHLSEWQKPVMKPLFPMTPAPPVHSMVA